MRNELDKLERELEDRPSLRALIPDVEVYHKAVRYALDYQEFQKEKEFEMAREQLATAPRRLASLREGDAPWLRQIGD